MTGFSLLNDPTCTACLTSITYLCIVFYIHAMHCIVFYIHNMQKCIYLEGFQNMNEIVATPLAHYGLCGKLEQVSSDSFG